MLAIASRIVARSIRLSCVSMCMHTKHTNAISAASQPVTAVADQGASLLGVLSRCSQSVSCGSERHSDGSSPLTIESVFQAVLEPSEAFSANLWLCFCQGLGSLA